MPVTDGPVKKSTVVNCLCSAYRYPSENLIWATTDTAQVWKTPSIRYTLFRRARVAEAIHGVGGGGAMPIASFLD